MGEDEKEGWATPSDSYRPSQVASRNFPSPPMKRRVPWLAGWLAGLYLIYGLLVFFGTLWGRHHEWWPLFLYPVIWPLSFVLNWSSSLLLDALFPHQTPTWAYVAFDCAGGVLYVGVGALWLWWLGRLFSLLLTRLFPFRDEKVVV